jgi:hypothetical protein
MNLPGERPIAGTGFTSRVAYREMHRFVSKVPRGTLARVLCLEKRRNMPQLKLLPIISILLLTSCFGVKQIHNYKKVKKEIDSVSNIVIINLLEVQYDKNRKYSEWEQIHSNYCDSVVLSTITKFINKYSKRKFKINTVPFQSDSIVNRRVVDLFGKLESIKKIDTFRIDDSFINAFSEINDRYILLVYQEGYCFPK